MFDIGLLVIFVLKLLILNLDLVVMFGCCHKERLVSSVDSEGSPSNPQVSFSNMIPRLDS